MSYVRLKLKWQHNDWGWISENVCSSLRKQVQLCAQDARNIAPCIMCFPFQKPFFHCSLESKVCTGQHLQRVGLENTAGHSICPSLSSDEAHFEKCLLWLLLAISTHCTPSERGQRGGSLSVGLVILHLSRIWCCWTTDNALSETLHTWNLLVTQSNRDMKHHTSRKVVHEECSVWELKLSFC